MSTPPAKKNIPAQIASILLLVFIALPAIVVVFLTLVYIVFWMINAIGGLA
jgi:hypothetical protein